MSTPDEWGRAFAKQAKADFDSWNALTLHLRLPEGTAPLPACQKLHFLQMACEKLAKAHLCRSGPDPETIQSSHAYTEKVLPRIVRQQIALETGGAPRDSRFVMTHCRHLAREIELLHPSVDDDNKRPDNCEYPWEDRNGKVHVPAEATFPALNLLMAPVARTLLKHIQNAVSRLAR